MWEVEKMKKWLGCVLMAALLLTALCAPALAAADGNTTYRVAYCSFDPGPYEVTMGTTCEARIYYGKSSFWFYLFGLDL